MMLYLLIDGEPKCQSARLRDAETLLISADPDLYESVARVTCAYSSAPVTATLREMAVHTLHRAIGTDAVIEWVNEGAHARALTYSGCYRAR